MPPLPRVRIETLASFAEGLRFTPPEAARRQMLRAEDLALEVLAAGRGRTFPDDYVLFRLTGYRPETRAPGEPPGMLVGEALLADLAALVERLSVRAGVTRAELDAAEGERWVGIEDLGARWGVSRKTVERYRRQGLIGRRARLADAGAAQAVLFAERFVRAFEAARAGALAAARGFTRIPAEERARMVRRAARYRRVLGWTLNRCAERIAARSGRGHETVRRLLVAHDAGSAEPVFAERGPLTAREKRVVERAARAGVGRGAVAARLGKSRASVHRVELERRAARLRELDLSGPVGPTFEREGAWEVLLAPGAVRTELGVPGWRTVGELVDWAERAAPVPKSVETARAVAYWFLRFEAGRAAVSLPAQGARAAALDEVETALRWASRLKAELVRSQVPLATRTVTGVLGRGLETVPAGLVVGLVERCTAALAEAADQFDPFRGGRLAAPAAVALNRAVTAWMREEGRSVPQLSAGAPRPPAPSRTGGTPVSSALRASAKQDGRAAALDDWTRRVNPWQEWLEPAPSVRAWAAAEMERGRGMAARVLVLRYGWDGGPARTTMETARELGVTAARVAGLERRGIAAARGGVGRVRK